MRRSFGSDSDELGWMQLRSCGRGRRSTTSIDPGDSTRNHTHCHVAVGYETCTSVVIHYAHIHIYRYTVWHCCTVYRGVPYLHTGTGTRTVPYNNPWNRAWRSRGSMLQTVQSTTLCRSFYTLLAPSSSLPHHNNIGPKNATKVS